MKNLINKFIAAVFVVIAFTGCTDKIENIGPNICPTNAFSFTESDLIIDGLTAEGKADLSVEGLNIKAGFSETVKWTLKITSATATKEFSGNSDTVNVWWFGNADYLPLFGAGTFDISLEIACLDPITKTIENINAPNFKNLEKTYGVLVRDWDKNGKYPVFGTAFNVADGWQGVNGTEAAYFEYYNTNPSPAGGYYSEFYSKNASLLWYFGGHSFPTSNFKTHLSTTNADSLYLNFFVQGYGYANTGLEIGVQESGSINYFYTAPIDWTGWKFVSVKMSELIVKSGPKVGTKLTSIANVGTFLLQLGSNPIQTNEAKSGYDFIIVTVGEPFIKE